MGKMGDVNADEAAKVTAITVDVEAGGAVVETVSAVTVKGVGALCAVVTPLVPPVFVACCRFLFLFSTRGVFHFPRFCLAWRAGGACCSCFPAV